MGASLVVIVLAGCVEERKTGIDFETALSRAEVYAPGYYPVAAIGIEISDDSVQDTWLAETNPLDEHIVAALQAEEGAYLDGRARAWQFALVRPSDGDRHTVVITEGGALPARPDRQGPLFYTERWMAAACGARLEPTAALEPDWIETHLAQRISTPITIYGLGASCWHTRPWVEVDTRSTSTTFTDADVQFYIDSENGAVYEDLEELVEHGVLMVEEQGGRSVDAPPVGPSIATFELGSVHHDLFVQVNVTSATATDGIVHIIDPTGKVVKQSRFSTGGGIPETLDFTVANPETGSWQVQAETELAILWSLEVHWCAPGEGSPSLTACSADVP